MNIARLYNMFKHIIIITVICIICVCEPHIIITMIYAKEPPPPPPGGCRDGQVWKEKKGNECDDQCVVSPTIKWSNEVYLK